MDRRCSWVALLALAGCAKGSLGGGTSFGVSVSTTQSSSADDGDSGAETSAGTSSDGGSADGDSTGPQTSTTITTDPITASDSSSDSAPAESSEGPVTTMTTDPSTDDGMPPPPDVGPWEACDAADCEAGNDCITITGLRANPPYCSPQCMTDADCPPGPSGDAAPVCALSADGAVDPTNCALLCEYDGVPYGSCPAGMSCTAVPDQMVSVSLCMWP